MTATPVEESQRLDVIDGLRGFALAGVLMANLRSFTLYENAPDALHATLPFAALDRVLEPAITLFVAGQFITIFSLLFGVGFSLQIARIAAAGEGPTRYARRLLILLVLGLAHSYVLWSGDILRYYALLGLALLPLANWTPRRLAMGGVAIALLGYPVARLLLGDFALRVPTMATMSLVSLPAFLSHSWARLIAMNLTLTHWALFAYWGLVFFVAGRLMLGAAIGKSGLLHDPARHAHVWKRVLWACLPAGIALTTFIQWDDYGRLPDAERWFHSAPGHFTMTFLRDLSTLSMGLGYMAAFVLLFLQPAWRSWLRHLVPVGRMALTNYLTHTVVGIAVFYGVGLGVGPYYGLTGAVAFWALLFGFQIAFSRWWLARFRFGPAEWAWRSLTYGQAQPMRR